MSTEFFTRNKRLMDALLEFAPEDSQLLNIPLFSSAVDPFVLCLLGSDRGFHGVMLLGFMQSINLVLAKILAAHKYIHDGKDTPEDIPQPQSDMMVYLKHLAISEYHNSITVFFLKLRLLVDELLRIVTDNTCDCIGKFLGRFDKKFEEVKPFLVALNASANYIKHDEEFLVNHLSEIPILSPSLKIKVINARTGASKRDFKDVKDNCTDKIVTLSPDESQIILDFPLSFFVENFNKFKELFEQKIKESR
ncbi:hypothetical protein [Legionella saoudiensis]|uniref:hypothetical protein n=1 Tax=Legionella saoudiensis TaxID=1750561 RepID=UPI000730E525|nr:hypothetical protein [Legionella saoudiensis]